MGDIYLKTQQCKSYRGANRVAILHKPVWPGRRPALFDVSSFPLARGSEMRGITLFGADRSKQVPPLRRRRAPSALKGFVSVFWGFFSAPLAVPAAVSGSLVHGLVHGARTRLEGAVWFCRDGAKRQRTGRLDAGAPSSVGKVARRTTNPKGVDKATYNREKLQAGAGLLLAAEEEYMRLTALAE